MLTVLVPSTPFSRGDRGPTLGEPGGLSQRKVRRAGQREEKERERERKRAVIRTHPTSPPALWHVALELRAASAQCGEGKAPGQLSGSGPVVACPARHPPACGPHVPTHLLSVRMPGFLG